MTRPERVPASLTACRVPFAQITSLNSNSDAVVDNVPDELATEIPRTLLLSLSSQDAVLQKVNRKKWRRQQVGGTHWTPTGSSRSSRAKLSFQWALVSGGALLRADRRR